MEGRWGRTARNFPAMAVAYLSGTVDPPGPPDGLDDPLLREFAVVSTRVLRGSLPQPRFGTERTPAGWRPMPGTGSDASAARAPPVTSTWASPC